MNNIAPIDQYLAWLEQLLTPARLQHSIDVMQIMSELTPIYSLDRVQAMITGLLHDAARDLDLAHQLALAKEAAIELRDPFERHPIYLHALVGAYMVAKELDIKDPLILDAIAGHSYAGNGMNFVTPVAMCLRFADLLAPVQEWLGMKRLRGVVYSGQSDEATLLNSRWLIEYLQEKQVPIHPRLEKQYQILSEKLGVAESFFERW